MLQPKLKTSDVDEFLEDEYKGSKVFQTVFKTYLDFKKAMETETKSCGKCKTLTWKGSELRCDCNYEEALNK